MSHRSQVSPSRQRAIGVLMGFFLTALFLFGGGTRWAAFAAPAPAVGQLGAQDLEYTGLRQAELSADPDELWNSNPRLSLRVLLLRAGREVPATVTAARRSERLAQREAALAWLREHLAADARVARLWESVVRTRLAQPQKTVQWCATVRTLGRLGATEFGLKIAEELGSDDPLRAHTARLALFDLYLRWFQTGEEFYTFWPEAQAACEDGVYMTTARAKDEQARQLLIQLLKHEPSRANGLLGQADPRLRAAAIGALSLDQADATQTLLHHLSTEVDGQAFFATVNALLQIQSSVSSGDPLSGRLRETLLMRLAQGHVELQAPLADALRRLPWSTEPTGDDSLMIALNALVGQLQKLADPERLTDRDTLVMCLSSLRSICERAAGANLDIKSGLDPVGPMLLAMMEESREADAVRIAAAEFLRYVGNGTGIELAVAVLSAADTSPELRYNLLGAIGDMALKMQGQDASIDLVLRTLAVHVQGEDAILRRRSLKYLGAPEFTPYLAKADPRAFIAALAKETVPELRIQLLDLVAAHGSVAQLQSLVALPNFDAICSSSPVALNRMAMCIRKLAGDQAPQLVAGIARLVEIDDEETHVLRLREALTALAALPVNALENLQPADHHRIVVWSMELRGAAGSVPGGRDFLDRLLNQHLAACSSIPEFGRSPELAQVRALVLSDLIALDPTAVEPQVVAEAFAHALVLCEETSDEPRRRLVLRDRARYLLDRQESEAATGDYLALFQTELPLLEGNPEVQSKLLNQRDLRQASALFARGLPGDPEKTKRRGTVALRSSLVLVHQSIWRVEPVAVRAQDLRDLASRGMALSDSVAVSKALAVFADLPPIPPAPEEGKPAPSPVVTAEGSLWSGLLDDPAVHLEFLGFRKRLGDHLASLSGAAPPMESDAPSAQPPVPNPSDSKGSNPAEGTKDKETKKAPSKESPGGG